MVSGSEFRSRAKRRQLQSRLFTENFENIGPHYAPGSGLLAKPLDSGCGVGSKLRVQSVQFSVPESMRFRISELEVIPKDTMSAAVNLLGFQVSGFGFRVSGFRLRVSRFGKGFWVQKSHHQGVRVCPQPGGQV